MSLPACQPISIRCAVWDGGTDERSELAATSLNTAPCYLNQLCIKQTPTTWLRKATHLHVLSVKKIREALTTRQWQPPRTMAFKLTMTPEGCLLGAGSPNSSSTASLASQIRRVFTATKLPSLPATLRELWYRVLVSGFVMGKHKTKEDARFCGHCERTCRTRSGRHYEDITHAFALCPLAAWDNNLRGSKTCLRGSKPKKLSCVDPNQKVSLCGSKPKKLSCVDPNQRVSLCGSKLDLCGSKPKIELVWIQNQKFNLCGSKTKKSELVWIQNQK